MSSHPQPLNTAICTLAGRVGFGDLHADMSLASRICAHFEAKGVHVEVVDTRYRVLTLATAHHHIPAVSADIEVALGACGSRIEHWATVRIRPQHVRAADFG